MLCGPPFIYLYYKPPLKYYNYDRVWNFETSKPSQKSVVRK